MPEAREQVRATFFASEARRVSDRLDEIRPIVENLAEAAAGIDEASDSVKQAQDFASHCTDAMAFLKSELAALRSGADGAEITATYALTVAKELADQGEALRAQLEELDYNGAGSGDIGEARRKVSRLLDGILKLLRRVLGSLCNLIAGMLTPKEWTLKAELGTPLSMKGGIEIKFGPPTRGKWQPPGSISPKRT